MPVNEPNKAPSKEKQSMKQPDNVDYFSQDKQEVPPQAQSGFSGQQADFDPASDFDVVFGTPVSMTGAGDVVVAYREAFEVAMREDLRIGKKFGEEYQLHGLSKSTHRLPYDMLVLTQTVNKNIYFYGLLLAGSITGDNVRQENVSGQPFQCYKSMAEDFDAAAFEEVQKFLVSAFGEAGMEEVGYSIIPVSVKADNANGVNKIMANAVNAIDGHISRGNPKRILTSKVLSSRGGVATNLKFTKEGVVGINSQPNRTDLAINLSISEGGRQQQPRAWGAPQPTIHTRDLIRSAGFVDLVRNPPQPTAGMGYGYGYNAQAVAKDAYTARLVISNLEQIDAANSLELSLLALASCELAANNMQWGQAFMRTYGDTNSAELHDIGAVGLEVNLTGKDDYQFAKINTKDATFDGNSLMQLLSAVCTPGLILALDIEEGGSQMWLHRLFAKAANGDAEGIQAMQQIVQAANNLTGNLFSQNFPQGQFLVLNDYVRVHVGRYEDPNGVTRDIRDIDYLAVLNTSQPGDLQQVINWSGVF